MPTYETAMATNIFTEAGDCYSMCDVVAVVVIQIVIKSQAVLEAPPSVFTMDVPQYFSKVLL